jgi:hypothetical protein
MSIYQYNSDLQIVAEHRTLMEASKALGIPERTISAATLKGSFCRFQWYFSRHTEFVPWERIKSPFAGKKIVVSLQEELFDQFLVTVGQRNKQNVLRTLIKDWINLEKSKK